MATNNDLGSLSYSLNIDTSKIPDTLRDVEKQIAAIGAAHKIDINVDDKKFIEQLGKILYGEDFKVKISLDESYKKIITDLKKQMPDINIPSIADNTQSGYVDSLIQKLKELEIQYKNLPEGADTSGLIREFKEIEKALDVVGRSIKENISKSFKEVMSISEDTIGSVKNKMASLEKYKLQIPLADIEELRNVDASIARLKDSLASLNTMSFSQILSMPETCIVDISDKIKALQLQRPKLNVDSSDLETANKEIQRLQTTFKELTAIPKKQNSFEEVMGMNTSSLNEISAKLREIAKLKGDISLDTKSGVSQITSLVQEEQALIRIQKEKMNTIQINALEEGSIQQLKMQLSILTQSYDNLSKSMRNSSSGQEMLNSIRETTLQLKEAEEASMRYQRNVGNYKSTWNGLSFQLQQVARELPSISYGIHTFFAAISNNVPMLADELKKAKTEYNALREEQAKGINLNQKAVPVWKQVIGSIFSWQTALVAALTVSTLYGKEIINHIQGMLGLKKETDAVKKAIDGVTTSMGAELGQLKGLFNALNNATKGTKEYKAAKDAIVDQFGKYYDKMHLEKLLVEDSAEAYRILAASVYEAAKAKALADSRAEAGSKFQKKSQDSLENMRNLFISKFGEDEGRDYFIKLRKELEETGEVGEETLKKLDKFKTTRTQTNRSTGDTYEVTVNEVGQEVTKNLRAYKKAQDDFNQSIQESEELVGDLFSVGNGKVDAKITSLIDKQKAVIEELKRLPEDSETEITVKNKEIQKAEKELKRLQKLGVEKPEKPDSKVEDARIKQYEAEINLIKQAYSDYKKYIEVVGEAEAKKKIMAKYGDQFTQVFKNEANAIEYATDPLSYYTKTLDDLSKMTSKRDVGLRNVVSRLIGGTEAGDDIESIRKEWENLGRDLNFEKEGYFIVDELVGSGIDAEAAKKQVQQLFKEMGISVKLEYNTFREKLEATFRSIGSDIMSSEEGAKIKKSFLSELNKDTFLDLLSTYQDYTAQRYNIEYKFVKDIEELRKKRQEAVKEGNEEMLVAIDRAIAQATKNKGEALISFDFEQLKKTPEYVRAFENLQDTSTETLNSLLQQLEQAKQTAAQVLTPDQLREYTSTIQSIMDELLVRDPFSRIAELKLEVIQADKELAEAEKRLNEVMAGNDTTITAEQALSEYNAAKDKSIKKTNQLRTAEKKVVDILSQLSRSIEDVGSSIGGLTGEIISMVGSIGTTIFSAIEGMKAASTTASATMQAIEKASVILAVVSAAIQIATKIADLLGGESDTEKYEKAKEVYESYIRILDRVIEKQLELAEALAGENAQAAYNKAVELVNKQIDAARTLGKQYLNSGASSGFLGIGSSASKGKKEVEDMSSEGWTQAAKALGMSVQQFKNLMGGRMTGLFDLSLEQLEELSKEAPVFISQLDSDTQKYFDQIITGVDKMSEAAERLKETYTGLTFDTLKDSLDDLLQAADTTFADVGDSFEDHMRNAVLNFVKNKYLINALEEWYTKFADAYSDETLTAKEVEDLRKMWETAYNKGQDMYDTALSIAGISKEREKLSGLSKGIQGLTESTAQIIEAYLNTMRDVTISIKMNGEMQLSVLESSQVIQSNMLTELVMMNSTAAQLNAAVRSALAQSGGDDGPGFRVYIKS